MDPSKRLRPPSYTSYGRPTPGSSNVSDLKLNQKASKIPKKMNVTPAFSRVVSSSVSSKHYEITRSSLNPAQSKQTSYDTIKRISICSTKVTPSKFATPIYKNMSHLMPSTSKASRCSVDSFRSSISGISKSKGITWPINSMAFKTQCVDCVLDFLAKHGASHINKNMLKSPTKSQFIDMFNIIYSSFVPGFKLGPKIEEEIVALLRALNYPPQMSKSLFMNVGSPHTWPTVVAMLRWLIDLFEGVAQADITDVIFREEVDDDDTEVITATKEDKTMQLKFFSICEMARAQSQQEKNELLEKYHYELESMLSVDPKTQELLEAEIEVLQQQLHQLDSEDPRLKISTFKERNLELRSDLSKLEAHLEDVKGCIDVKMKGRSVLEQSIAGVKASTEEIMQELACVEDVKRQQNFTIADIRRQKSRVAEAENKLATIHKQEAALGDQVNSLEKEQMAAVNQLTSSVLGFNGRVGALESDASVCELSPVPAVGDCFEEATEAILHRRNEAKNVVNESKNVFMRARNDKDKAAAEVQQTSTELLKAECKERRLIEDIKSMKLEREKAERAARNEVSVLNEALKKERSSALQDDAFHQNQKKIDELKVSLDEANGDLELTRTKAKDLLAEQRTAYEWMLDQKDKMLTEFEQNLVSKKEESQREREQLWAEITTLENNIFKMSK